jgi:hypothetical protein
MSHNHSQTTCMPQLSGVDTNATPHEAVTSDITTDPGHDDWRRHARPHWQHDDRSPDGHDDRWRHGRRCAHKLLNPFLIRSVDLCHECPAYLAPVLPSRISSPSSQVPVRHPGNTGASSAAAKLLSLHNCRHDPTAAKYEVSQLYGCRHAHAAGGVREEDPLDPRPRRVGVARGMDPLQVVAEVLCECAAPVQCISASSVYNQ